MGRQYQTKSMQIMKSKSSNKEQWRKLSQSRSKEKREKKEGRRKRERD